MSTSSYKRAQELGSLTVTTDPGSMAVEIRDGALRIAAEGVSPLQVELEAGLYMVTAIRPGAPNLSELVKVPSKKKTKVALTDKEPTTLEKVVDKAKNVVRNFAPAALGGEPAPKLEIVPITPVHPEPFHIRFLELLSWTECQSATMPKFSFTHEQGTAIVKLNLTQPGTLFAQIASMGLSTLNVALPPVATNQPVDAKLRVLAMKEHISVRMELESDWANSAAQYLAQGLTEQARQVLEQARKVREPRASTGNLFFDLPIFDPIVDWFQSRRKDPAAGILARYVRLRLGEIDASKEGIEVIADIFQESTDGHVITAESHARAGRHKEALHSLLRIRPGRLPLFTEGFSMAVTRLRQYSQERFAMEKIVDAERINHAEAQDASELLRHFNKWSPVVDLNAVTLTFTGSDLVNPAESQLPVEIESAAGWDEIMPP